MMFRAPLLMVPLFASAAVALLGSVVILPLGYAYVALAVGLRRWLGPQDARESAAL